MRRFDDESRASYEIKGVVNISFPILNAQGNAVAGLTVPYVKRIEGKVGIPDIVEALRVASQHISETLGAVPMPKKHLHLAKEKI